MALTPSNMLPLHTVAPDFSLPGTDGKQYSLQSFQKSKLLLVMFICNHCPFVKHVRQLIYRGRLDASRPGTDIPVTGAELRNALDAALAGQSVAGEQLPGMGCNIKWKPGNAPA